MVGIGALTYHAESLMFPGLFIPTVWFQPFFLSTINGPADCEIQKRKNRPFGGVNINIPANKI